MAFEINGKVGPGYASDGSLVDPRMTKDLAMVTQDLHGRLYETVYRGNVFEAVTATTGVAPGTTIGTTAAFALFNPPSSGKNLVVIDMSLGYVSGTLGAGTVYVCANTNPVAAAVTGTAITPVGTLLSGAANTPIGKPFTTATLPAAPTPMFPAWQLSPMLATSVFAPNNNRFFFESKYIITPGCTLSLEAVAGAGTTPLVTFSMSWEEIQI
jgi:hypothetical protein